MKPEIREYHIGDLLFHIKCPICESGLEWEAYFDADGTDYRANCCGKRYYATTSKLSLIAIETEVDEDDGTESEDC